MTARGRRRGPKARAKGAGAGRDATASDGATRPSRVSRVAIVGHLKLAARKGDRVALTLAIDQMKLWAFSPRYWEKYLGLLSHPLARLVDLIVIKQGEKIARQKGWVKRRDAAPARPPARPERRAGRTRPTRARPAAVPTQPLLFPDLL